MIDPERFECTCKNQFISRGDEEVAKAWGITPEQAHAMADDWEEILDKVLTEGWISG